MRGVASDLRLIGRQFRKSPGFTITAVLMLAFGIGASTAIFSVVGGVLLRPLPFPHADRLVTLGDQVNFADWGKQEQGPVTPHEVVTYERELYSFSTLGGYGFVNYDLSGVDQPVLIHAARMTPSVFSALGTAPLMERVFTQQEDTQRAQVTVLSYGTWKSRFGGNPNILGTKILLDRTPYIVIGVMPRNFAFPLTYGPHDSSPVACNVNMPVIRPERSVDSSCQPEVSPSKNPTGQSVLVQKKFMINAGE